MGMFVGVGIIGVFVGGSATAVFVGGGATGVSVGGLRFGPVEVAVGCPGAGVEVIGVTEVLLAPDAGVNVAVGVGVGVGVATGGISSPMTATTNDDRLC